MENARVVPLRGAAASTDDMAREVRAGLLKPPRSLPSKYFYDEHGSRLFDDITRQPEYYQTRTELRIIEEYADDIVRRVRPRELVELGGGAGRRSRRFLDVMQGHGLLQRCTLVELSAGPVEAALRQLVGRFPGAQFEGRVGDYVRDFDALPGGEARLLLLLANSLGNLDRETARALLQQFQRALGADGWLLVGLDLVQDSRRLERAYDDAAGVTARFNRNILTVINRHLGADFDLEAFEHLAMYIPERARIEMHLRSRRGQRVSIPAAELVLELDSGETVRTEVSYKYTRRSFLALLEGTGLELERWFTDPENRYALALVSSGLAADGVQAA